MKWILWLSPLLCFLAFGSQPVFGADPTNPPTSVQALNPRRVGVDEFAKMVQDRDSLILDVRTPGEFQAGHIKGAVNVDFFDSEFEAKLAKLDKSKTCLVYCAGGGRSAQSCKKMSRMQFTKLVDLAPGFSGWQRAGKPIEK